MIKRDRERAGKIGDSLSGAFVWSETKQGWKFWNEVQRALRQVRDSSTTCDACGQEVPDNG